MYSLVCVHNVMLFEGQYGGVNKTLKSKQIKGSFCKTTDIGKKSSLLFDNAMCPLVKMTLFMFTFKYYPLLAFSLFRSSPYALLSTLGLKYGIKHTH